MADARVEKQPALREIAGPKYVFAVTTENANEGIDRDSGKRPIGSASRANPLLPRSLRSLGHTPQQYHGCARTPRHGFTRHVRRRQGPPRQAHRARQEQGRAVGRPLLVAGGAAGRRLARGRRGLVDALHHPLRQVDRGRAGEAVGLRRADQDGQHHPAVAAEAPALGRVDLVGAQGADRDRVERGGRGRSSPICASATTTPTRATRRRRSSS